MKQYTLTKNPGCMTGAYANHKKQKKMFLVSVALKKLNGCVGKILDRKSGRSETLRENLNHGV